MFCRLLLIALLLSLFATGSTRADEAAKKIFVHYMPWYATQEVSGRWGWHWTMNKFNPELITNGQRDIASHDYPLIGPYDSNDPDALECHVLLMKLAGIDGVIIDWYGSEDFRDYKTNHRNTLHLIQFIKQAGLQFAICYEDQTVKHMIAANVLPKSDGVAHGTKVMRWLGEHWFHDDAYAKINDRPVLLVFGPQYFQQDDWQTMLTGLSPRPLLYGLPHLSKKSGADGAFGWPPVSGGKEIAAEVWRKYLAGLYARTADEPIIATAFPGFHDIYQEAGVSESHGSIDHRDGATLTATLRLAAESDSPLIQIATWNDYGEGTMIEPTKTQGYRYLETVQRLSAVLSPNQRLAADDLRMPVLLYTLKKRYAGDAAVMRELARAAELIRMQKCDQARAILANFDRVR